MTGRGAAGVSPDDPQLAASDPGKSTWLGANAGSGKTSVLIDRVARLLLAGTRPERILCLTYTRAAAGEMQNRLFRRLGAWSMLPDDRLRAELARFSEAAVGGARLAEARRLFAQAVETPGGLKIQTIHAFCGGLLRRFPVEAGIAPGFVELDEDQARQLARRVAEDMASGPDAGLLDAVATRIADGRFGDLLGEISLNRAAFGGPRSPDDFRAALGLRPGYDTAALLDEVFTGGEGALVAGVVAALTGAAGNDAKAAQRLQALLPLIKGTAAIEALEGVLLLKSGARTGEPKDDVFRIATQTGPLAALMDDLNALAARVAAARPRRMALALFERTLALDAFARRFLPLYAARKAAAGALDFDDLIARAGALLSDPSVAAWVLWRLDGGLDHILVDEAQDTAPAQWTLIERLTEEMTAGEGARRGARAAARTLFVVGDPKQSIYSFQGADLAVFGRVANAFRSRFAAAGQGLLDKELIVSYRSSAAILRVVDTVFDGAAEALGSLRLWHTAHDRVRPGRVDLWDPVPDPAKETDGDWTDPVAPPRPRTAAAVLAGQIATEIRAMLDRGTQISERRRGDAPGLVRPLGPGDILILVQRRAALFGEIIRALKAQGLPVAGADRMTLTDELAVRDVLALLRFLALPEDDLSLAVALRSPLIGLTEQALFTLSHGRGSGEYLWAALRDAADRFPEAHGVLQDLRDASDFLRPYELIERILIRHDGRRRLLARLGTEAEDALDALLARALAHEQGGVASLTAFLIEVEGSAAEVKRQLSAAGNAIRVMTVHGAKGLEAPVVILPDAGDREVQVRAAILTAGDGTPIWGDVQGAMAGPAQSAREAAKQRAAQERLRLLYVALTRAESWLIVCAEGAAGPDSWHGRINAAMTALGATAGATGEGATAGGATAGGLPMRRIAHGDWPADAPPPPAVAAAARTGAPPDWLELPVPPLPEARLAIRPSALRPDLSGDPPAAGDGRAYGTWLHLLLDHLPDWPAADWGGIATDLLEAGEPDARPDPDTAARLLADARRILTDPDLAALLSLPALREAEVAGRPAALGGRAVEGRIDRLIVTPDRVVVIDYKSHAHPPARPGDVPPDILAQMGAYGAVIAEAYPGRTVDLQILWTATGRVMDLPCDIVRAALQRALSLDLGTPRS
jgi:ATP-dependent helicase/nuclease subunit A